MTQFLVLCTMYFLAAVTAVTGAELIAEVKGERQFLVYRTDHRSIVSPYPDEHQATSKISAVFRAGSGSSGSDPLASDAAEAKEPKLSSKPQANCARTVRCLRRRAQYCASFT